MNIGDLIWNELVEARHKGNYARIILSNKKIFSKWINIGIIIISSLGGFLGLFKNKGVPVVTNFIVLFISVVKAIESKHFPNQETFDKLNKIIDFYFDHYNKLENLFFDYQNRKYDDEKIKNKFYRIRSSGKEISKIVNEIILSPNSKIGKKSENEVNLYFKQNFKTDQYGKEKQ